MRHFLHFSFLFFSVFAYSQDCADLRSGETIRIDKAGGSLEHFRNQDQDGLGICYANATSALLQSVLPRNPEISYLQLASIKATSEIKASTPSPEIFVKKNETQNDKWDLAIELGSICGTIAAAKNEQDAKKKNVLCPKKKTNFEEGIANGDPSFKQYKSFLESAKYMNLFYNAFADSSSKNNYEEFKKAFAELITNKRNQLTNNECRRINAQGIESVFHRVLPHTLQYRNCFDKNYDRRNEYWCKMARTVAPDAVLKDQYTIVAKEVGAPLMAKLKSSLEMPRKQFSLAQMKNDFSKALVDEAKVSFFELYAAKELADEIANEISNDQLNTLINEFNEIKTKGFSPQCVERLLTNYIRKKDFEKDWENNNVLCGHQNLMRQASALVLEYDQNGLKDINRIIDFLQQNAELPYHEAMMSLHAGDCRDEDKVSLPNLKCENKYVDSEHKSIADQIFFLYLKNNKALAVSFCASILEYPKSQFKTDECGASGSNHLVILKGLKCERGKYKYLVQNSWGKDYVAKNPAIETEKGHDSHWLDEQSFYDSVRVMTTLDIGEKK